MRLRRIPDFITEEDSWAVWRLWTQQAFHQERSGHSYSLFFENLMKLFLQLRGAINAKIVLKLKTAYSGEI